MTRTHHCDAEYKSRQRDNKEKAEMVINWLGRNQIAVLATYLLEDSISDLNLKYIVLKLFGNSAQPRVEFSCSQLVVTHHRISDLMIL